MNIRLIALTLSLLALGAPARAYRKTKNPRRRKKPAVAVSTAMATAPEAGLAPGRWAPEVRAALMRFVLEKGSGSPGYDAARPPLAVLPFNGFAVAGDPGELVFERLVREAAFKFSDEFWKEVPLAYGRQRLRAAYEQFAPLPRSVWEQQPTYRQYLEGFARSYRDMCVKIDPKDCRAYLARLLIGFQEQDALAYAKDTLKEERGRGFKDVPEVRLFVGYLQANGIDVWFAELDPRPVLEAAAEGWPVPAERLISIKQGLFRDRCDGQPIEPIPIRGGKVDAWVEAAGRPPDLVVGASIGDAELLRFGAGLRIVVGGDPRLTALAKSEGWLVQPPF